MELLYTPDYTEWHFMAGRSDVSVEQEQAARIAMVVTEGLTRLQTPPQPGREEGDRDITDTKEELQSNNRDSSLPLDLSVK